MSTQSQATLPTVLFVFLLCIRLNCHCKVASFTTKMWSFCRHYCCILTSTKQPCFISATLSQLNDMNSSLFSSQLAVVACQFVVLSALQLCLVNQYMHYQACIQLVFVCRIGHCFSMHFTHFVNRSTGLQLLFLKWFALENTMCADWNQSSVCTVEWHSGDICDRFLPCFLVRQKAISHWNCSL